MKWQFVGCNTSQMPQRLLSDEKIPREEFRTLLEGIPLEKGEIEAVDVDELVAKLLTHGIYPIKIKPFSKVDGQLYKMKAINDMATKKKRDEEEKKEEGKEKKEEKKEIIKSEISQEFPPSFYVRLIPYFMILISLIGIVILVYKLI